MYECINNQYSSCQSCIKTHSWWRTCFVTMYDLKATKKKNNGLENCYSFLRK